MKYPKLWGGPSPEGEARLRGLEMVDAPYLTVLGIGFSSHKRGAFREVYASPPETPAAEEVRYLSWFVPAFDDRSESWSNDEDPLLHPEVHPEFFGADQRALCPSAGRLTARTRFRDRAAMLDDTDAEIFDGATWWVSDWPSPAWRLWGLETLAIASKLGFIGGSSDGDVVALRQRPQGSAKPLSGLAITPTLPAPGAVLRAEGGRVHTGGFLYSYGMLDEAYQIDWAYAELGRDGTVVSSSILARAGQVATVSRIGPDEIVFYAARADFASEWSSYGDISVVALRGDGRGRAWEPIGAAGITALLSTTDGLLSIPLIQLSRSLYLYAARASDGRTIAVAPALRFESQPGSTETYLYTFDGENTEPYIWSGGGDDYATCGVTVLGGEPDSLAPIARLKIPGRELAPDQILVSGRTIVVLVAERKYSDFQRHPANADYMTAPALLYYSLDDGQNWDTMDLGRPWTEVGLLSVDVDGKFLLPMRADDEDGLRWNIYAFSAPDDVWAPRGYARPPLASWRMGAVLPVARTGIAANPLPGTPWVCDDRVRPPWES